jgi:hypothetical protein
MSAAAMTATRRIAAMALAVLLSGRSEARIERAASGN